jgi:predicted CopG family antitoxin
MVVLLCRLEAFSVSKRSSTFFSDVFITYKEKQKGEITGWNIDILKQDSEALEKVKEEYLFRAINRPLIDLNS